MHLAEQGKKFRVTTLGCRTNQYESQAYQDQLKAMGYTQAQEGETADICIVNTCTVTESADSHSRHAIRQLVRDNPHSQVVVTGCFAEQHPEKVHSIEGVTHVVSNKDKENLLAVLFPETELPEFEIRQFSAHTRAFVKVQDGCNSFCTYCVIPYVRGRSRSRSTEEVIKEVQTLVENGFKEIVLTGINIGDYDGNPSPDTAADCLANLVRSVDRIPGVERLRVSSIDPDEVNEDLADAILNGRSTCPSMHLVLQSGSNVILKRMNRKYTRQIFLNTVERMRQASPDFTVTTDIIVGFPGETETDFNETLEVMREIKFAKVHMFPYSERPRTRAALFPNKVAPEIIKARKQTVLHLAEQIAYELRAQYVGREMQILTESRDESRPTEVFGHTSNFLPVWAKSNALTPNELVTVKLIENTPDGLIGLIK